MRHVNVNMLLDVLGTLQDRWLSLHLILDIWIISHSGLAKQQLSAVVYIQIPRKTRGNAGNKMFSILWSEACGCCLQFSGR